MPWPSAYLLEHDAIAVARSLRQTIDDRLEGVLEQIQATRFDATSVRLRPPVLSWVGQRVPEAATLNTPSVGVLVSPEPDQPSEEGRSSTAGHLVATRFVVVAMLQQGAVLTDAADVDEVLEETRWTEAVVSYGTALRWTLDQWARVDAVELRSLPVHRVDPAQLTAEANPVILDWEGRPQPLGHAEIALPLAVHHYIIRGRL